MQLTTLVTSALLAITGVAAAPVEERANSQVIGPFSIKISAPGKTYNNMYLGGSHIGAAIDLAVPYSKPAKVFYINATDGGYVQNGITYGRLAYNIDYPNVPYQGGLATNLSSNVAGLLLSVLTPEYSFSVSKTGEIQLGGLSRWFGCYGMSYGQLVPSVNWQFGTGKTTQKECQPLVLMKSSDA